MNEKRLQARTHYIHRLKYSTQEKIAGAFVLVAIGVLAWLLFSSGKSIVLFEDQITLYGHLQTLQPINEDTDIIVGGLSAGSIEAVDITEDNQIIVTMRILKRYSSLLRADSTAVLNTFNLAIFDKSVIEITVGSPDKPQLKDGSTIQIQESINIKNLLNRVTPAVDTLIRIVDNIDNILSAVDEAKVGDTIVKANQLTTAVSAERISGDDRQHVRRQQQPARNQRTDQYRQGPCRQRIVRHRTGKQRQTHRREHGPRQRLAGQTAGDAEPRTAETCRKSWKKSNR